MHACTDVTTLAQMVRKPLLSRSGVCVLGGGYGGVSRCFSWKTVEKSQALIMITEFVFIFISHILNMSRGSLHSSLVFNTD